MVIRSLIHIITILFSVFVLFSGCGGSVSKMETTAQDKVSIVHTQDTRDSDNYSSNLVMSMLAKRNKYNTLFISIGNEKSKKNVYGAKLYCKIL